MVLIKHKANIKYLCFQNFEMRQSTNLAAFITAMLKPTLIPLFIYKIKNTIRNMLIL